MAGSFERLAAQLAFYCIVLVLTVVPESQEENTMPAVSVRGALRVKPCPGLWGHRLTVEVAVALK